MAKFCIAVVLTLAVGVLGFDVNGEERREPFSESRLLQSMDDLSGRELLRRIVESKVDYDGASGEPAGFFEYYLQGGQTSKEMSRDRLFLDDRGDSQMVINAGGSGGPLQILSGRNAFSLEDTGRWSLRDYKPWRFATLPRAEPFFQVRKEFEWPAQIRLAVSSLCEVAGPAPESCHWDPATATLSVNKGNGTKVFAKFRTPNDQANFGSIFSEITIKARTDDWQAHRCLIRGTSSPLRLNLPDTDELARHLECEDRRNDPTPPKTPHGRDVIRLASQWLKAERLLQLDCEDRRPQPRSSAYRTRFERAIGTEIVLLEGFFSNDPMDVDALLLKSSTVSLSSELEIASRSVERAICIDLGRTAIVDDPALLWLGFERALIASRTLNLLEIVTESVLPSSRIPLDDRVRLAIALGDCGLPGWVRMQAVEERPAELEFLRAILHARWEIPPTEPALQVCREHLALADNSPACRFAAVDSLIRWRQFADIPEPLLNDWLENRLASDTNLRHSTLKALTRSPRGRELLVSWMEREQCPADVRQAAASLLAWRARSTLATQRFDFMSPSECERFAETVR